MKELIQKILKKYIGDSGYKKNVLTLIVGRVIAQALPILITPLFTRIYSPEEFGIFSVYFTIVSIISMISNLRYSLAIILPTKEEEAKSLVNIASIFSLVTSILSYLILLIWGSQIFKSLGVSELSDYRLLLAVNILIVALYESLYYFRIRRKDYKSISISIIVQSIIVVLIRVVIGFYGSTSNGLLYAYFLGYLLSYLLLLYKSSIFEELKINWGRIKKLLIRYKNFPRFSLLADSFSILGEKSPNLLLSKLWGSTFVGYLSMSDKVLGSPIWFITSSVGDVFKQEAAERIHKEGNCEKIFYKTSKTLFIYGLIPFILIFLFVPPLTPFLLGAEWTEVGQYIRIFSIMFFAKFVVTPVSYIMYIVGKQKLNIFFQASKLLVILIAFGAGYLLESFNLTLYIWSVLMTIHYVIMYFVSLRLSKGIKTKVLD
jgi:O-antigen/teichoic acid export membrane protein